MHKHHITFETKCCPQLSGLVHIHNSVGVQCIDIECGIVGEVERQMFERENAFIEKHIFSHRVLDGKRVDIHNAPIVYEAMISLKRIGEGVGYREIDREEGKRLKETKAGWRNGMQRKL